MNEMKHHHEHLHHQYRPYWKRAHQDWRFVLGVLLMIGAMVIYVMSQDLAWRPSIQPQQPPLSGVMAK